MTTLKKFSRRREDFVCENCGRCVKGNGYTNHCPRCLWSKHVDINPGDRLSECKAMMEPIQFEILKGAYVITHQCTRCDHSRKNKMANDDSLEAMLALTSQRIFVTTR